MTSLSFDYVSQRNEYKCYGQSPPPDGSFPAPSPDGQLVLADRFQLWLVQVNRENRLIYCHRSMLQERIRVAFRARPVDSGRAGRAWGEQDNRSEVTWHGGTAPDALWHWPFRAKSIIMYKGTSLKFKAFLPSRRHIPCTSKVNCLSIGSRWVCIWFVTSCAPCAFYVCTVLVCRTLTSDS